MIFSSSLCILCVTYIFIINTIYTVYVHDGLLLIMAHSKHPSNTYTINFGLLTYSIPYALYNIMHY